MAEIIVALIGFIGTIVTTLIANKNTASKVDKYDAKNAIIMMIMEDHILWSEHKLPVNYQNILHEFDVYTANGGNSYLHDKVDEYKKWYAGIQEKEIRG